MFRNFVFDLGGVAVNFSPKDYLVDLFYNERTERKVYDAVFGSEEWLEMDRGRLAWAEAAKAFKKKGKAEDIAFEVQAVLDNWTEMLTTRTATVTLMRLLKKRGYRLYFLSNISHEVLALLKQRDFWPLFDGGVASCEVGILKPDMGIFHHLISRCQLVPQETIFADDNNENALAAYNAGITGIHFTDVPSFCRMLVPYGIEV